MHFVLWGSNSPLTPPPATHLLPAITERCSLAENQFFRRTGGRSCSFCCQLIRAAVILLNPGFIGYNPAFSFHFFLNFRSNLSLKFVCQCLFRAAWFQFWKPVSASSTREEKKEVHVTEVHEVRPIGSRRGVFEKSDCPNDNTKSIIIKPGLSSPIIF